MTQNYVKLVVKQLKYFQQTIFKLIKYKLCFNTYLKCKTRFMTINLFIELRRWLWRI